MSRRCNSSRPNSPAQKRSGSRGALRPPSPLRTVRDNLSSYGSSPGHLIAFSGVPLMMAPGMDHSAVVEVVRTGRLAWDDVILVEQIIHVQWPAAECTAVGLCRQ